MKLENEKTRDEIAAKLGNDAFILAKYNTPGIYCWKFNNSIVYIGKSQNMLERVAWHLELMLNPENEDASANKYEVLREAVKRGVKIDFDVLCRCEEKDLYAEEAKLIQTWNPSLNVQIPYLYRKGYRFNYKAKTITLDEVLEKPNSKMVFGDFE